MRHPRFLPLAAALLLLAVPAGAQQGDSATATPFRPGQWAVQFSPGYSTPSLGALRFRSPRSAWVIDASLSGFFGEDEGDVTDGDRTDLRAALELGTRRFRPVAERVHAYTGFGIFGSVLETSRELGPTVSGVTDESQYRAGLYAELGGNWMITPHLALGARTRFQAGYQRQDIEYAITSPGFDPSIESNGAFVNLGGVQVLATIFF